MRGCATLVGLLWTIALPTRAESVTDLALTCGDRVYDFAERAPTTPASALRIRHVTALQKSVERSLRECNNPEASHYTVAACDNLVRLLQARHEGRKHSSNVLMIDRELERAARRAIDNAVCDRSGGSEACMELFFAELEIQNTANPLGLQALAEENYAAVKDLRSQSSNEAPDGAQRPTECAENDEHPICDIAQELRALKAAGQCNNADWYLGAVGQWKVGSIGKDGTIDICVDVAVRNFFEPLEVTIQRNGNMEVHSVLPGSRTRLKVPPRGEVLSVAVRAHPDAHLLGRLARRELAKEDKEYLLSEKLRNLRVKVKQNEEERFRRELGPRELESLLEWLRYSSYVTRADTELEKALQQLANTNQLTDAVLGKAQSAIANLREVVLEEARVWRRDGADSLEQVRMRRRIMDHLDAALPAPRNRDEGEAPEKYRVYLQGLGTWSGKVRSELEAAFPSKEATDPQSTAAEDLKKLEAMLCSFADRKVLVASNDAIVELGAAIVDYDFAKGAIGAPTRRLGEGKPFFVRVHRVPPGGAVAIEIDKKTVAESRMPILGVDEQSSPAKVVTGKAPKQPDLLDVEHVGLAGTLVMRVDPLPGGRLYEFRVCTSDESISECSSSQISGFLVAHTLPIDGEFSFGIRFGFGVMTTLTNRPVAMHETGTSTSSTWSVGRELLDVQFSLPMLLAWYPNGRNPIRPTVEFGFTTGFDVRAPTEKLYPLGIVVDYGGVGLNLSATLSKQQIANVPFGRVISSVERPDLDKLFGTYETWQPGAAVWLTTDADLYRVLFNKVTMPKLPQLGGDS